MVALHKHLHELEGDLIGKDQDTLTKRQLDRGRFLKLPRVKQQLEERTGKLHKLADKVDTDHKEHTISTWQPTPLALRLAPGPSLAWLWHP